MWILGEVTKQSADEFVTERQSALTKLDAGLHRVEALLQQPAAPAANVNQTLRRCRGLQENKRQAKVQAMRARAEIDDAETERTHGNRHTNMRETRKQT